MDDPRWLDHLVWQQLVVRAPTAAMACVVAAGYVRAQSPIAEVLGNESPSFASGIEDEKLYAVHRLAPDSADGLQPEGPDEVLRATSATPVRSN